MEYLTDADYETALKNGNSKVIAYQRFYFQNFSKRRAITQPMQIKHSKEYIEIAEQNGISYNLYSNRVRKGMSPEEASTKPVAGRKQA